MPARRSDRGQILVIFALAFVTLVLVVGLVIDGSYGWVKRREAQNAADFAALAGARVVRLAQDDSSITGADVAQAITDAAAANHDATVDAFLYTDGNGQPLGGAIDPASPGAIPTDAAGITVPGATLDWRPFIAGIIGIDRWETRAQATARFVPGNSVPPCSLCVLGGLAGSSSGSIDTEGSILVGGSGTASSSVDITSQNGSIVVADSGGTSSSAQLSAPNGSIWFDGDYEGSSSSEVSAPNGSVYVTGSVDFTSSGDIEAGGAVMIGGDLDMSSSADIDAGGSVSAGGDVDMRSSSTLDAGGSVTFGGNLVMRSSARVTAAGSVSIGGNITMQSSSRIIGDAVGYVGTYSCSSCTVTPSPTVIGSVSVPSVPSVPTVEDPYATLLPDATTAKVQEVYPAYPGGLTTTTFSVAASSTGTITPTSTQLARATVSSSATATLNPGIYEYLRCQSSAKCFLNAGTYYFNGGASALDLASSSTFRSNGPVTLVFLNDSGVKMSSSTNVKIEAPDAALPPSATFPWPGVAIFFARDNDSVLEFSSSSSNSVTGIIYAPAATLKMTSSTNQTVTSTVVVGHFQGSSSSSLTISSFGGGSTSPPGPIQLVH